MGPYEEKKQPILPYMSIPILWTSRLTCAHRLIMQKTRRDKVDMVHWQMRKRRGRYGELIKQEIVNEALTYMNLKVGTSLPWNSLSWIYSILYLIVWLYFFLEQGHVMNQYVVYHNGKYSIRCDTKFVMKGWIVFNLNQLEYAV